MPPSNPLADRGRPLPSSLTTLPGHLIRRTQQLHDSLWNDHGPAGLTSPQYAVLHALAERPDIDQTELGTLTSLDRSTLGELVQRMVARSLVVRGRDPADARRNLLRLTARGVTEQAEAVDRVLDVNRRLVAALDEADRLELARLLTALLALDCDLPDRHRPPG